LNPYKFLVYLYDRSLVILNKLIQIHNINVLLPSTRELHHWNLTCPYPLTHGPHRQAKVFGSLFQGQKPRGCWCHPVTGFFFIDPDAFGHNVCLKFLSMKPGVLPPALVKHSFLHPITGLIHYLVLSFIWLYESGVSGVDGLTHDSCR